jgi:hypothetical protein
MDMKTGLLLPSYNEAEMIAGVTTAIQHAAARVDGIAHSLSSQ